VVAVRARKYSRRDGGQCVARYCRSAPRKPESTTATAPVAMPCVLRESALASLTADDAGTVSWSFGSLPGGKVTGAWIELVPEPVFASLFGIVFH
jgi:hypothetical protein